MSVTKRTYDLEAGTSTDVPSTIADAVSDLASTPTGTCYIASWHYGDIYVLEIDDDDPESSREYIATGDDGVALESGIREYV